MNGPRKASDPRGGHVRIYNEILDSHAWRAVSWADQGLYIALRRKLKGTNNGNIEATMDTLRHAGFTSSATVFKGLRALQAAGLIARTREGHLSQGAKVCNLFRFTDEDVYEQTKLGIPMMKATNDWSKFRTLAEARAAVKAAHDAAVTGKKREWSVESKKKNAKPVQKLNRTDSETEARGAFPASEIEHGGASSLQILNTVVHA